MNRSRASSVSFSRSQNENENENGISSDDEDNIQMSLAAPKIQNYLAKASQRNSGILGRCLPIPFERAAKNSWWDPHFDSEILEGQYKSSAFPQFRLRFRYTLFYTLAICVTWFIYYILNWFLNKGALPGTFLVILASLTINNLVFLGLVTNTRFFKRNFARISKIFTVVLYGFSLGLRGFGNEEFGDFGYYSICFEVILISYTLLVVPVYFCVLWGLGFSIVFEGLGWYFLRENVTSNFDRSAEVYGKICLHFCVHLIGIHILVNTNVRQRGTFFKVGQSLLVRKQLELEKQLATKMIHSVMPPKVADTLLNFDNNSQTVNLKSLFRPFNMSRMENVSILFADIVGFTKMSSTKTAEELVEILNDLFERFDHLCYVNNCEKISTLGDCYYCVSGCPEPNQRHAKNCVEMGLGMIQAIKQFDEERNESVNMRVGVHTGVVLCGIVGTKRFKFDVWSNDVTLANKMESTGKPGMVHISEKTQEFLDDIYDLDEGQPVFGYKTYFILGRKSERHFSNQFLAPPHKERFNRSPKPGPGPLRPRLLSCNTKNQNSPNFLLPSPVKIKTNSLPNILDQTEPEAEENCEEPLEKNSNSRKGLSKIKKWKIPKFLINTTKKQENEIAVTIEENQGYQQIPEIVEIIEPKNEENFEKNDKIIDVKSYISQSRSDVGNYDYNSSDFQFIRSESCRSPHDINSIQFEANNIELSPLSRGRSATMAAKLDLPNYEINKTLEIPDSLNLAEVISVNSRKDSGIRSNSRRSSIQQQIFAMNSSPVPQEENMLEHRVSGYYTSSQSSINLPQSFAQSFSQTGCVGLQKLRKQSDLQLIKCVQDNFRSKKSYFIKPPLSNLTLFFKDKNIENCYRKMVFSSLLGNEQISTLAMYNTLFDILVTIITFFLVNLTIFFLFEKNLTFYICFGFCTLILAFATLLIIQTIFNSKKRCPSKFFLKKWYPWQIFGALIVALPILTILSITLGNKNLVTNPEQVNFKPEKRGFEGESPIGDIDIQSVNTVSAEKMSENPSVTSFRPERKFFVTESSTVDSVLKLGGFLKGESPATDIGLETVNSLGTENPSETSLRSKRRVLEGESPDFQTPNGDSYLESINTLGIERTSENPSETNVRPQGKFFEGESPNFKSDTVLKNESPSSFVNTNNSLGPNFKSKDQIFENESPFFCEIYTFLFFIGLIHFCNFTQINFWIKNIFCTVFVVIFFVTNFDKMSHFESEPQKSLETFPRGLKISNESQQSFESLPQPQALKSIYGLQDSYGSLLRVSKNVHKRETMLATLFPKASKIIMERQKPFDINLRVSKVNDLKHEKALETFPNFITDLPNSFENVPSASNIITEPQNFSKTLSKASIIIAEPQESFKTDLRSSKITDERERMFETFLKAPKIITVPEKLFKTAPSGFNIVTDPQNPFETHLKALKIITESQKSFDTVPRATKIIDKPQKSQDTLPTGSRNTDKPDKSLETLLITYETLPRATKLISHPQYLSETHLKDPKIVTESQKSFETFPNATKIIDEPQKSYDTLLRYSRNIDASKKSFETLPRASEHSTEPQNFLETDLKASKLIIEPQKSLETLQRTTITITENQNFPVTNLKPSKTINKPQKSFKTVPRARKIINEHQKSLDNLPRASRSIDEPKKSLETLSRASKPITEPQKSFETLPKRPRKIIQPTSKINEHKNAHKILPRALKFNSEPQELVETLPRVSKIITESTNFPETNLNASKNITESQKSFETIKRVRKIVNPSKSTNLKEPQKSADTLPKALKLTREPQSLPNSPELLLKPSCTPHVSLNPVMLLITLLLLLILIYFINREFEISYRLNFFVNHEANRDKGHVQNMKNQADWLLLNLIPKNVAENLKKNAKYSEKTKNVAIIFASIVNFNEMYEETYNGGKEYLRVLNELIADFDELLTLPKYRSVEKIKTIGSTFMAASGLNPQFRSNDDPHEHLYALMDFAIELNHVIQNFNLNLLEFNLILRVGYNIGDVVAGVIGTSKLHYDIWGDAVNIASRMDSCGVSGRIQIGENCLEILQNKYEFEPRGNIYVKGKDLMNVFLLSKKKDDQL